MNISLKKAGFCAVVFVLAVLSSSLLFAQGDVNSFKSYQLSAPRVAKAYAQYNEILKKEFEKKNLSYPPKEMYVRAFKAHNEFEVWVKNPGADTFSLFKLYKI